MKAHSKTKTVKKMVEVKVEEKTITLEMSEKEARRLLVLLGNQTWDDWKNAGKELSEYLIKGDTPPSDWGPCENDVFYDELYSVLEEED